MLKELTKKNRSYRKFKQDIRIPREKLIDFIDTARFTASSVNIQPLKFYISDEKDTNEFLRARTAWARLLKGYDGPAAGENPAAYIVICIDRSIAPEPGRFAVDAGIAAQSITLSATEAGYGCCMIKNFSAAEVAAGLSLDENILPFLIIAAGVPDEEIILEDAAPGAKTPYYRDAQGRHHVPKRTVDELIIKHRTKGGAS